MRTSIASTALATVVICLLGTACSSSASRTSTAGASGGQTTSSANTTAAGGGSGKSGGATCKQLTFAQVQPLITGTVISVTAMAITLNGDGQQCEFNAKGTDATGAISVQVLGGSLGTEAYAQAVAGEGNPIAVPGVGDKATRDTESGAVNALKGDLFCAVSYSSSDQIPGVGPLEEAHGATINIGENFYDTIAQAMGTLCNRIYGSGNTTADLSSLIAADATATPSD